MDLKPKSRSQIATWLSVSFFHSYLQAVISAVNIFKCKMKWSKPVLSTSALLSAVLHFASAKLTIFILACVGRVMHTCKTLQGDSETRQRRSFPLTLRSPMIMWRKSGIHVIGLWVWSKFYTDLTGNWLNDNGVIWFFLYTFNFVIDFPFLVIFTAVNIVSADN